MPSVRPLAFALGLAACSAATTTQRAYVAPSNETITSDTEVRQENPPTHLIYVENRSTVPVRVFSVTLSNCENIRQPCGPKRANLRIGPGERLVAIRVEPDNPQRAFSYNFNYSWQADSSSAAALTALAASGDAGAAQRLAATRRADSIRKSEGGPRYNELGRDDFTVLAGRIVSMRAHPESLVLAPGEQTSLERLQLVLIDDQGRVAGGTRWMEWMVPGVGIADFVPPDRIIARRPGRMVLRFRLANEAQQALKSELREVEVPIIVAYRFEPNAPTFAGRAVDADSKTPLACVRVALEDSAENVVNSTRTDATGAFYLQAPHPGTYRVRVEMHGWMPVYGPNEVGAADETKQSEYLVRFTEQLLVSRPQFGRETADFEHAQPAAVTNEIGPRSTALVQGVTLGGSESTPILGIIGRVPPMTTWMQFVVDSAGRVDKASILMPPGTSANAKASVASVLPRVRFSPARERGTPVCEMLRMQVNFSPR
ncbi:MAG TPA: carboxypeptidase-like regulatory domain-containing protein [Gemmatimonadaceae bacterium]|nr:carboxypeptidase-like regulatory domain-containing protein [Gemmatimonadaceae bacterium]